MRRGIRAKTVIWIMVLVGIISAALFLGTRKIAVVSYEGLNNCSQETMEQYLFQGKMSRNPIVFFFQSKFREHPEIPFVEEYEVEMVSMDEFHITVYEKSIIGYLKYMGECMYFDKDGIVVEVTAVELEGQQYVEGIDFDRIVLNEKIPVKDDDTFHTILDITQLIHNYDIPADTISISKKLEITLHIGNVRVAMGGNDEYLSKKVNVLSGILKNMEDKPGVLDMSEYNDKDIYSFTPDAAGQQ